MSEVHSFVARKYSEYCVRRTPVGLQFKAAMNLKMQKVFLYSYVCNCSHRDITNVTMLFCIFLYLRVGNKKQ